MKIKKMILLMLTIAMFAECIAITNVEAKVFTKTGGYYTGLCTKDNKSDKYDSYAKKLKFKKSKFTLYGTMHYTKPGDVYSSKIYKKAKRTYKLASNCKFYRGYFKNGKYKKKKISYKKLRKLSLPLTKGTEFGRTLMWDIKNGKVVELEYREY